MLAAYLILMPLYYINVIKSIILYYDFMLEDDRNFHFIFVPIDMACGSLGKQRSEQRSLGGIQRHFSGKTQQESRPLVL